MDRFFITEAGQYYKAEKALRVTDMERLNPSEDQLACLPENGKTIGQYAFDEKLRLLQNGIWEVGQGSRSFIVETI